jgi:dTDP-4-amino-4,6-dideoxygalactose transaminase
LERQGIGTLVHYPQPVHLQPAYADLGYRRGDLPVTERVAAEVLSLPLRVGLSAADVDRVAAAIERASAKEAA